MSAAPVVKWAGGKTRLLPQLLATMPPIRGRYFEPFAGGAALFFALQPERAVLGDANADLCALYSQLAHDHAAVVKWMRVHAREHLSDPASWYATVRDRWNQGATVQPPDPRAGERAAELLYLNRACFNGLWRVNSKGAFNTPRGDAAEIRVDADGLRAAAPALQRAEVRCGDYRATVADAAAGDVVYFDPPYDPATKTASFTAYTADRFGDQQQRELAATARDLVARGVHVVLSSSDTPLVRSLYPDFELTAVSVQRAVGARVSTRKQAAELIPNQAMLINTTASTDA